MDYYILLGVQISFRRLTKDGATSKLCVALRALVAALRALVVALRTLVAALRAPVAALMRSFFPFLLPFTLFGVMACRVQTSCKSLR